MPFAKVRGVNIFYQVIGDHGPWVALITGGRRGRRGLVRLGRVTLELARRRELAELVTHHVLGNVHRYMLLAVMHRDRQANEVRHDGRAARPCLDGLFVATRLRCLNLFQQMGIAKRPLFQ